ncbi:MAG: hypothetical protein ABSH38_23520 [Verrucomicrobiota bacterium]|jgi:hypothetical protein
MKHRYNPYANANTLRLKRGVAAVLFFAVSVAAPLTSALAEEPFNLQQHFNWKIALCYHPMYLLVDEDRGVPVVGERVPPWGAPTAEAYVERVKRNLDAVEKDPEAKLNYEWSACELDALAQRFPDVMQRLRQAYDRGQLDFVDGAYSQAHMSTLESESNWRQFEYGLEVFQRLLGKKIVVYASQESQLQPQIPQILGHFGYKYMVMPAFPWKVTITKGPFDLLGSPGFYLAKGAEFINATALDGTSLPAYFPTYCSDFDPNTVQMRDLWSTPPLWIDFPDMAEYGNPLDKRAKPVLLEHALDERFQAAPPRASGRVGTFESYVEGVWAEEHLRANHLAEENAVLAGNLLAMAKRAGPPEENRQTELRDIWNTILKYEHHDVMWIEVTDLRRKAITNFLDCIERSRKLMAEAATQLVEKPDRSVAIFNGASQPRSVLLEVNPAQIPGGGGKFQKFGDRYLGFRELPAGGFKSFPLAPDGWVESKEQELPDRVATDDYNVELSKEGLIKQITTAKGEKLLAPGDYLGGEIRAAIGNQWVNNRSAACRFYDGDVCSIVERSGLFGVDEAGGKQAADASGKLSESAAVQKKFPLRECYYFFKHQPEIKAELEFDFNGNTIGDFHIEETKLNVYYPTAGGDIYHDIPFGYLPAQEREQLFATTWLYCGGLVYVNYGTIKHWIDGGVMANTMAWGGRRFSNRIHLSWTNARQYDLQLYGKQTIDYDLIPFGKFDGPAITRAVQDLRTPICMFPGSGQKSFYQMTDPSLAVTSLFEKDGDVWVRGYQMPSATKGQFRDWEIFNRPLKDFHTALLEAP